jgi:hypothetical protein
MSIVIEDAAIVSKLAAESKPVMARLRSYD